jgi:hypothetical protein
VICGKVTCTSAASGSASTNANACNAHATLSPSSAGGGVTSRRIRIPSAVHPCQHQRPSCSRASKSTPSAYHGAPSTLALAGNVDGGSRSPHTTGRAGRKMPAFSSAIERLSAPSQSV